MHPAEQTCGRVNSSQLKGNLQMKWRGDKENSTRAKGAAALAGGEAAAAPSPLEGVAAGIGSASSGLEKIAIM